MEAIINPKKAIFLGTPDVAALVLEELLKKARSPIQLCLVVTQAPARSGRGNELIPSPVHQKALEAGIPVLTPASCKDRDFLNTVCQIAPDICITAAFGQVLPDEFLKIPKYGTVNIHPSLLPKYRGAAPVQRAIQDGLTETGVTVLFTVKEMDAGPMIAQHRIPLTEDIKSPELLRTLFLLGTHLLIKSFQGIFAKALSPIPQEPTLVSKASKIRLEEGLLNAASLSTLSPLKVHNMVRAFTPWPGVKVSVNMGESEILLKLVTTKVESSSIAMESQQKSPSFFFDQKRFFLKFGAQEENPKVLEILELQLPGKNVISALDFKNLLQNKTLQIL